MCPRGLPPPHRALPDQPLERRPPLRVHLSRGNLPRTCRRCGCGGRNGIDRWLRTRRVARPPAADRVRSLRPTTFRSAPKELLPWSSRRLLDDMYGTLGAVRDRVVRPVFPSGRNIFHDDEGVPFVVDVEQFGIRCVTTAVSLAHFPVDMKFHVV